MDLNDVISKFTGSASIINNVNSNVANITSVTSNMASFGAKLPSMGATLANVQAMTQQAQTVAQDLINKLPVMLPVMKAVHVAEKKAEMATGGLASTAASPSLAAYFNVLPSIDSAVSSVTSSINGSVGNLANAAKGIPGVTGSTPQAVMASLSSVIPPTTIPDPNDGTKTITNPAYTDFMNTHSSVMSTINGHASDIQGSAGSTLTTINQQAALANSTASAGVAKLKALSFAKFCASPQPDAIQTIINQNVVKANIPPAPALDAVHNAGGNWVSAQTAVTIPSNRLATNVGTGPSYPSPTTSQPSQCTLDQLQAISSQRNAAYDAMDAASQVHKAQYQICKQWLADRNGDSLKANDPPAFQALTAELRATDAYQTLLTYESDYQAKKTRFDELSKINKYMREQGPWPGNPNGPW